MENDSPRLIETEIRELKHKILDMSELVQLQLEKCCLALQDMNHDPIRRILKKEKDVDKYDNKIQKRCERIIALYQPVANDLRFVFSVLKINLYLESIGDSISSIAYRLQSISSPFDATLLGKLCFLEMLELTKAILRDSLQAFFNEDVEASKAVFPKDDRIDEINNRAVPIVVDQITTDVGRIMDYLSLLQIIKNLEEIGDNSIAISEEALFHTEGVVYRHTELKYAYKEGNSAEASQGS
jgi:phosphate transport system protein